MTDNRTIELREKLNKLIIELDRLDIAIDLPASDMTLGEYEQEREKLLDGFIQAIAATLGSEREKAMEELVRDMYEQWAYSIDGYYRCLLANYHKRMVELGLEVCND